MSIAFGSAEAAAVKAADRKRAAQIAADEAHGRNANGRYETALLATCRVCGGVVGITTNTPERARNAARDAAEWVREGYCVNDLPIPDAKAALARWCDCGEAA